VQVIAQKMGLRSRCGIESAQGKLSYALQNTTLVKNKQLVKLNYQIYIIHEREEVEDIGGQNFVKGRRRVSKGVSDRR